jgi:hypothetical protein
MMKLNIGNRSSIIINRNMDYKSKAIELAHKAELTYEDEVYIQGMDGVEYREYKMEVSSSYGFGAWMDELDRRDAKKK